MKIDKRNNTLNFGPLLLKCKSVFINITLQFAPLTQSSKSVRVV